MQHWKHAICQDGPEGLKNSIIYDKGCDMNGRVMSFNAHLLFKSRALVFPQTVFLYVADLSFDRLSTAKYQFVPQIESVSDLFPSQLVICGGYAR